MKKNTRKKVDSVSKKATTSEPYSLKTSDIERIAKQMATSSEDTLPEWVEQKQKQFFGTSSLFTLVTLRCLG